MDFTGALCVRSTTQPKCQDGNDLNVAAQAGTAPRAEPTRAKESALGSRTVRQREVGLLIFSRLGIHGAHPL